MGGQQQYVNPDQIASKNRAMWYPNGEFDSFVPAQIGRSWRPEGAAFRPSSDYRQTVTTEVLKSPGARRRGKGFGIRPLYPALPRSPQAPIAVHDPTAAGDTDDPRTLGAQQVPAELNIQPTLWDRILGGWATSPVGMLFIALGAVVLFSSLFGGRTRGAGRGARSVGGGVAGVGSEIVEGGRETGSAGKSAAQKAVSGAVDAVESFASK